MQRGRELVDQFIDMLLRNNEGRRQQDVIAGQAVGVAATWVADQPMRHGLSLDPAVKLVPRIERLLSTPIAHQFEPYKEAPTADVAYRRVIAETRLQRCLESLSLSPDVGQ